VLTDRVEQREVKTHTPIGAVARRVGIVFAAYLDADRFFPNLQDLADLKNLLVATVWHAAISARTAMVLPLLVTLNSFFVCFVLSICFSSIGN